MSWARVVQRCFGGGEEARSFSRSGLRQCWGRAGEARGSVCQPRRRKRKAADDLVGSGLNDWKRRWFRREGDGRGNELAQCAVVFLMHARALRMPVILSVWANRRRRDTPGRGGVHDTDDARQKRLCQGGGKNPTANNSRKL